MFSANDGVHGYELWITDGTAGGTAMVKDIRPGARGSYPGYFAPLGNGMTVFTADDGSHNTELWVTDGSEAGTVLVKDIYPGKRHYGITFPKYFTALGNGKAVFDAWNGQPASDYNYGSALWVTDGTEAGTIMLNGSYSEGDKPGVYFHFNPQQITSFGDGLAVFSADDGVHGRELWVTDGTVAGTELLADINPGGRYSGSDPRDIAAHGNGKATFFATGPAGQELWVTDGTAAGTTRIPDVPATSGQVDVQFTFGDISGSAYWVTGSYSVSTSVSPGSATTLAPPLGIGDWLNLTDLNQGS
jgi:ELWxxDGT repeat protein